MGQFSFPSAPPPISYFTNFATAPESPISENGIWVNNSTWNAKISTITGPNRAVGNQDGAGHFDDSYALLARPFTQNVLAQGTMYKDPTIDNVNGGHEVELLMHMYFNPATGGTYGYECNISSGGFYQQIVRWDGLSASSQPFTVLADAGVITAPSTGDVFRATIINGVITTYIDYGAQNKFVQLTTATDTTYTSGAPGIGMFLGGSPALPSGQPKFAFTTYLARAL